MRGEFVRHNSKPKINRNSPTGKVKSNGTKSSGSQSKRSNNYRQKFIEKNPGIKFFKTSIYFCHLCQMPVTRGNMQVDHVMPISRTFGTNATANLAPLCASCNRRKSNKIDGRILIIYLRKLIGVICSIPFKVLDFVLSIFLKLDWKLKLIVVVAILLYLNTTEFFDYALTTINWLLSTGLTLVSYLS